MARLSVLLQVGILVWSWSTWMTNGFNLEERLSTDNYIEEKVKEFLGGKDGRLGALERKVEQEHASLTAKVTRLEAQVRRHIEVENALAVKVVRLEAQVQRQESLLIALQNETSSSGYPKYKSYSAGINEKSGDTKNAILRTCRETRASDPSLSSGMYWIDPDGQGIGDDPIYVYCDMTSGSTAVLHDSESPLNVGHCADPGCYTRVINYSASKRQMAALAQLSNECHQSIKYDCNCAPLEVNGVAYSWWNDRDGNPRYFWSGSDASVHTCQCGIDHNCVEAFMTCNCDSSLPTNLTDDGAITDKNILPITRLNFGRTILESSFGQHSLGRLECMGQVAVSGMPSSCSDLWQIGHTLSGLYSVMGTDQVETVYCDFTKLHNDPGFQTLIGFVDVKSSPTYFYVQRNNSFNITSTPIPFQVEKLNVGGAMNLTTGVFTTPVTGKYFFSLSGIAQFLSSSNKLSIGISLRLNGNSIGFGYSDDLGNEYETFSIQSTLNLQAGDKIWLEISQQSTGACLSDHTNHFTHFIGWLLEENISSFVKML